MITFIVYFTGLAKSCINWASVRAGILQKGLKIYANVSIKMFVVIVVAKCTN